ncbi:hypothetical protein, partial [Streptomyces sp. NPDC002550]
HSEFGTNLVWDAHTTSTSLGTGSNTLMICKPLVSLTIETATHVVQVMSLRRVAPSATRRAMPLVGSLGSTTLPSSGGLDKRSPVSFTVRLYQQTQANLATA